MYRPIKLEVDKVLSNDLQVLTSRITLYCSKWRHNNTFSQMLHQWGCLTRRAQRERGSIGDLNASLAANEKRVFIYPRCIFNIFGQW